MLMMIALTTAPAAFASATVAISEGPAEGAVTNAESVTFTLSTTLPVTQDVDFYCSLDNEYSFYPCSPVSYPSCVDGGSGAMTCTMSKTYPHVAPGPHVFRAFAVDCAAGCDLEEYGEEGPLVARSFSIDRTAPTIAVTGGPTVAAPHLVSGNAVFPFAISEPAVATCTYDFFAALPCASSFTVETPSNGTHNLTIRAIDAAGNVATLTHSFRTDVFKPKKCKKPKGKAKRTVKAKKKYRACRNANAKAKARWKKRNGIS